MENTNNLESGFRITNLILVESNFKREALVTFDAEKTERLVNVDVNVQIKDNIVFVTETVNFEQKLEATTEVTATIKMVGVFEQIGETPLDLDYFGRVNGAAIIFPYIREHLTNLSAKAGIGLIIMPPFNFTRQEQK